MAYKKSKNIIYPLKSKFQRNSITPTNEFQMKTVYYISGLSSQDGQMIFFLRYSGKTFHIYVNKLGG